MSNGKEYSGIDLFRIIAAVLVVVIHTSPFEIFGDTVDFLSARVAARIAVPFFFMTSGFFLERGIRSRQERLLEFTRAVIRLYLIAMVLYVPLNLYMGYFKQRTILTVLVKDILFDGTFYHLWYFPAAIVGSWIAGLLIRKLGRRKALFITLLLYMIGLFGDSYYGLAAKIPSVKMIYENLFTISDYTRNGLFFAPVFFVLGALSAEKANLYAENTDRDDITQYPREDINHYGKGHTFTTFLFSLLIMMAEGITLHSNGLQRHDSMYVMLLPCVWYFFQWILTFRGSRNTICRDVSIIIYIIHPFILVLVRMFAKMQRFEKIIVEDQFILFTLVLILSSCLALCCHSFKSRIKSSGRTPSQRGRAWLEVSASNLKHNAKVLQQSMPRDCNLMAVMKAEAYGHGGVETAKILNQAGVRAFAVATLKEGIALRESEVTGEILILGYTDTNPAAIQEIRRYDLIQTACDYNHAKALNKYRIPIRVHIAVDSGMHRNGFSYNEVDKIAEVFHMKSLKVCGIYTHLCVADSLRPEDVQYTHSQIAKFYGVLMQMEQRGIQIPKVHVQSSYGYLNYPDLSCDYVRAGIALFGVDSRVNTQTVLKLDLKPVLSLKSRIALIRTIAVGETVGYDRLYLAETERRIAVVPVGYADGYPRYLSCGKGQVLVRGKRVPVIGRICMDQMMIDITDVEQVNVGDIVTLIGEDGQMKVTIEEVSEQADSIANELLSRMGRRLELIQI